MQCSPFSCLSNNTPKGSDKAQAVGSSIENHMKLAANAELKTIHILLLGPGSSGKTTILKQIKKINSFDDKGEAVARETSALPIKQSVVDYMKILCTQSVQLNAKHAEDTLVHPDNEHLRNEILALPSETILNEDIAQKIKMLWADDGIQNTLTMRQHFQIHENVSHFFDRADIICSPSYVPSFDDYVRFRQKTHGFSQDIIPIDVGGSGTHYFDFTDVAGQRSERRKWMNFVGGEMHAMIFILALSDYDLTMAEDNQTNRLQDSLDLFSTIVTRGMWRHKSILVFFNKYDLFLEKIKTTPITVAFDDFTAEHGNPNDENDVVQFMVSKVKNVMVDANIQLTRPVHVMRTSALDTDNIQKIFRTVTIDLVKENLRTAQLL
eukprot:204666_1